MRREASIVHRSGLVVSPPVKIMRPTAPPAYRPQPIPRVLQAKVVHAPLSHAGQLSRAPFAPPQRGAPTTVHPAQHRTPEVKPAAFQLRKHGARPERLAISRPRHALETPPPQRTSGGSSTSTKPRPDTGPVVSRVALARTAVQRFKSRVVQATKIYPNLHPGAVEPIDESNIFRLNSFADQYRLHRVNSHAVNVPNQQYNFVRTTQGDMLLHSRYRHPSIAEGKQVLYAGEIFFNNGKLDWWSNGSGHYQPDPDTAEQANLPMDSFFSYQQIIKGEHTRKRG
jgi:hypothetical protein